MNTYDTVRNDRYTLTEKQRELAAKNHNLIYRYAAIKEVSLDEFYGVFAIGLCKAARVYDASTGYKFSTLAFRSMENEYKNYWRHELNSSHIPSDQIVSYHAVIDQEKNECDFLATALNKRNACAIDTSRVEIVEFFRSLSTIQRIILNGLLYGYSESELGEYIGCTKSNVNRIKQQIRKKWEVTKHRTGYSASNRRHVRRRTQEMQ